ncbi:hypothetical protein CTEN210_18550 [Chaetoceros tenuissimus]|uniref:Uncharacterized protein n=1 Tax=Chaetoceros tenuissimus TaxID=426638 RepID=A0AAD3HG80_9STRA|nr:hypothetical protein CTEN210_18550 [Chaetoceros tenuissimus]
MWKIFKRKVQERKVIDTKPVAPRLAQRQVAAASRRLGEAVQRVVLDAKQGKNKKTKVTRGKKTSNEHQDEKWKIQLLKVLGSSTDVTDVEILLQHSACENFVSICMENELPPNLIHCMRLLRVVELKNSNEANEESVGPTSLEACNKVEKLLCFLCVNTEVGEQLRPHLFGLLSLSAARYPSNAVHIAKATSNIIARFAKGCFTPSMCSFLHDREMIRHMTEDMKELCGMSPSSLSTSQSNCLHGNEAEIYGLWYYSLAAIVNMVIEAAVRCENFELLREFESVGGYDVLKFAIDNSSYENREKILELQQMLGTVSRSFVE